ncbi:DNA-binding transcriptional LysR family regulator [Sagittula marina]|uniref:DNA-binding transcriptional LysR family regulator n=1 Tax=Sagittula marina TaxID=943940 RepID=A0A7W6DNJ4_9RHOB|nr:LysR family transcriptional regulator [Sagittula marina]MBB3984012.1 DNA-binding transcriptional LysR family regulator [Sagittula marina]
MERVSNPNSILAFVTVAREGSVSRAADVLNLTQPAVSHQIRRLSEDIGLTLFTRTPRGLVLTPDATAILPKAEQVLAALSEFRRSASQQIGQVSGTLRIGTIVDPSFIRLGRLLSQLGAAYPLISTALVHGVSGEILEKVQRHQIDAGFFLSDAGGFDTLPSEQPLHVRRLAEFKYRIIAPPGWESRVAGAAWRDLAALPWIGTPPASVHNRLLSKIFAEHGCVQNVVALVDHEASMLEMVRSGVGLSLSRDSIALHERQTFGLVVCDNLSVPACLGMLTLEERRDTPVVSALFDQLEAVWRQSPNGSSFAAEQI